MAMIKTQTPGIYQVRGKKGKVKYQLMTYVQVSDPLSTSGFKWKPKGIRFASYREAVDAKIKIQAEIKSGQYIEPKDATVKELMAAWLKAGETRGITRHGRWKIQTHLSHARQYNDIVPKLGGDQGVEAPQVADRASGRGVERGQKLGGRERAPQRARRGFQMGASGPG